MLLNWYWMFDVVLLVIGECGCVIIGGNYFVV